METEEAIKDAVQQHVKIALLKKKWTITELIQRLNERFNRRDTVQNLSNKLKRGTLRYSEALEIAAVLGYKIEWLEEPKAS